jgi:two-component system nitrate/nitrite response regulator NarL
MIVTARGRRGHPPIGSFGGRHCRRPDDGSIAGWHGPAGAATLTAVPPVSFTLQPAPVRHDGAMPPPRVRVVVADDHPLFREGIERAVRERPELELVGAAADGREALSAIRELEPQVAVLDVRLPGLDGLQILNALVRDGVPSRVLFLSASGDPEVVYRAVQTGAAGYFRKDADREAILDAIAAVARGRTVIDPELQGGVFEQVRVRGTGEDRPVLTAREREVLTLMADGLSGPQIAERLIVALPTVKTHQARLYEKLGVSERAAAVAEAMRRGLLE